VIPTGPARESETLHQLKNHLGLILTYCELVLECTDASDRRHQDVVMIQQAAQRAMTLVPELRPKHD
jgi:chemotaxis regulatin CheY-phosphate phosphatase CheZ